jgi:hypothetical protein
MREAPACHTHSEAPVGPSSGLTSNNAKHSPAISQFGCSPIPASVGHLDQFGSGSPSSVVRPTGFVQASCLRDEVVEYWNGIFEPVANEAVDGPFSVIEQLQPKQRYAIKVGLRTPKHADLAAADRGEQNRCFRTVARNGRESAVGSRNFQFSQRPFERVAVCQSSKSPKGKNASGGCSKSSQKRACFGPPIICYWAPSIALGTIRPGLFTSYNAAITDRIRIIRREAVPDPVASRSALRTDARRGFSIGMICRAGGCDRICSSANRPWSRPGRKASRCAGTSGHRFVYEGRI